MAIVKMKKLRLMAVRSEKDRLLRELESFGCVEFSELSEELSDEGLVRESSDLLTLRNRQNTILNAIGLLDRYAPEKKPLLSAKPQVETETLLDDSILEGALEKASFINGLEEKIKRLTAEENRQNSLIESVRPWLELDLPLDTAATERSAVLWGSIPARIDLQEVISAVESASDEAELFRVSGDKSTNYVLVVCIREALPEVQESLRRFGFTAVSFTGEQGNAKEAKKRAEDRLAALSGEKESVRNALVEKAPERNDLKLAADVCAAKIARAEAEGKLMGLESTVVMQGWVPAEKEEELASILEGYGCAWETEEPDPSEYPDVPVQLKNNRITNNIIKLFAEQLHDAGGIYTLSNQPNSVISNNIIKEYGAAPYATNDRVFYIYCDEATNGFVIENNYCPEEKFGTNQNGKNMKWRNNGKKDTLPVEAQ